MSPPCGTVCYLLCATIASHWTDLGGGWTVIVSEDEEHQPPSFWRFFFGGGGIWRRLQITTFLMKCHCSATLIKRLFLCHRLPSYFTLHNHEQQGVMNLSLPGHCTVNCDSKSFITDAESDTRDDGSFIRRYVRICMNCTLHHTWDVSRMM